MYFALFLVPCFIKGRRVARFLCDFSPCTTEDKNFILKSFEDFSSSSLIPYFMNEVYEFMIMWQISLTLYDR